MIESNPEPAMTPEFEEAAEEALRPFVKRQLANIRSARTSLRNLIPHCEFLARNGASATDRATALAIIDEIQPNIAYLDQYEALWLEQLR